MKNRIHQHRIKMVGRGLCAASLAGIMPHFCNAQAADSSQKRVIPLDAPVSQSGTISLVLRTDQRYFNGQGQENYEQSLVTLPGINAVSFRRTDQVVNLRFLWDEDSGPAVNDILVDLPNLPGPEAYFVQLTWDSARGLSEGYLNGQPLRVPGSKFEPWWVAHAAENAIIGAGRLAVEDLKITARYTPPGDAVAEVPLKYRGEHANLLGHSRPPVPIPVATLRGKLLYESPMDSPESLAGWVAEGPLELQYGEGSVVMRSRAFEGNTVFWCPRDFPDSFVAEWEFEPVSHYGLAIAFFAAKGENGEDIFDPGLPPRDGNFNHYIKGAITSYHVSYFANVRDFQMGRPDSNLRKNNKFYRVGGGPVAIAPGAEGWQHIQLIKQGNRIQLACNGVTYVDWTDNEPDRYGPAYGDGKIGLRQMTPTIGRYRNFRVWELLPQ